MTLPSQDYKKTKRHFFVQHFSVVPFFGDPECPQPGSVWYKGPACFISFIIYIGEYVGHIEGIYRLISVDQNTKKCQNYSF